MTNAAAERTAVPHVVKGLLVTGSEAEYGGFQTPAIDLDDLVWNRSEPGPAFETPIDDIIDFLVEVGHALNFDRNDLLQEALEMSMGHATLDRRILENTYRAVSHFFSRDALEFQVAHDIGREALDGWADLERPDGGQARVRAFPPRLAHITAGNTPAVAVTTIVRGALGKGVNLIKMPANDLFTATAVLRTMMGVDPDHPTTRSFSAVYWRGGDRAVESAIMRSQYFDKLVVWGGGAAVDSALSFAAPGFEIVSFDPKVSISMVSGSSLIDDATMRDIAGRAATDITLFDQDACAASRYLYADGDPEQIDRFCELLSEELGFERHLSSAVARPLLGEIRDEIEVLKGLEPFYRVWGDYSGRGLVVRSDAPVDFYPQSKTVNVVMVDDLRDAVDHATVATQTVGIWPPEKAAELRNALASRGVQRIARLGEVAVPFEGLPHDGFYPMSRVARWVMDDS